MSKTCISDLLYGNEEGYEKCGWEVNERNCRSCVYYSDDERFDEKEKEDNENKTLEERISRIEEWKKRFGDIFRYNLKINKEICKIIYRMCDRLK